MKRVTLLLLSLLLLAGCAPKEPTTDASAIDRPTAWTGRTGWTP